MGKVNIRYSKPHKNRGVFKKTLLLQVRSGEGGIGIIIGHGDDAKEIWMGTAKAKQFVKGIQDAIESGQAFNKRKK